MLHTGVGLVSLRCLGISLLTVGSCHTGSDIPPSCEMASAMHDQGTSGYESGDSGASSEEKQMGYDYPFVGPVDAKYECPICLYVLRDPMQTECGHRFCNCCITRWCQNVDAKCPSCGEVLAEQTMFPDNFAKREINNLKVHCTNQGCQEQVELLHLKTHLENCRFCEIQCPSHCGKFILKNDMQRHVQYECDNRNIVCQLCHREILFVEKETHEKNSCIELEITCQYCGQEMRKKQIQEHWENDCEKFPVPCRYTAVGCMSQPPRGEVQDHLQSHLQDHMDLLLGEVKRLSLQPPMGLLSRHSARPDGHFTGQSGTFSDPGLKLLALQAQGSDPSLTSELSVKSRSSNIQGPSDTELLGGMADPSASIYRLQGSGKPETGPINLLEKIRTIQDDSSSRIGKLENRIEEQNRLIRELTDKNIEMESRYCKGSYIWKVTDYQKRRREALEGEVTVLHSPGFYSGIYGYRLCIRLNLNGVDSATGRHMSLFVHFMKGDYDDLLPWPFRGKITLSILDQNEVFENRQHISEVLMAKPHLAAFKKPTTLRNHKGFGYMEFAPIALIETSSFVRNDTIFIRAKIEHEFQSLLE